MLDLLSNIDFVFVIGLILAGFLIGFIAAMVGIGGGLLMVPFLVIIIGLNAHDASSISLLIIIFTSGSGSFAYYRQKRIDLRTGLLFALCVVPSSFIGSWIASEVDPFVLIVLFGILLLVVSSQRIYKLIIQVANSNKGKNNSSNEKIDIDPSLKEKYSIVPQSIEHRSIVSSDGKQFNYQIKMRQTLLGAVLGGFLGGLLGVGGGIIFVPVLLAGGLPAHIAVATSSFVIIFTGLSGSLSRLIYGINQVEIFNYAIPLIVGTVIGARISATRVKKISSEKILIMFYVIVFLSGIRMILKAFGWFP